jgi:hypothetical protein
VFDPGLGQVRAGFLVSRYGFNFCGSLGTAQKQTAREKSRAGLGGLIAAGSPESRQTGAKAGQKAGIWPILGADRPSVGRGKVPMKPTGSIAVVLPTSSGQGQNG